MGAILTRVLSGFLSTVVFACVVSTAQSQEMWTDYPDSGVGLGDGWNAIRAERVSNSCLSQVQ
jgi:hypothetical protein